VVHVITRLSLGGSSENTVLSVRGLQRAGHDCLLVAGAEQSESRVVEAARADGCRVELSPSLVRELAPVRDLRALGDLLALFRRARPDLVHTHTSKAGFLGRLAARLARVPLVLHTPHGHVFYGGYYGSALTAVFVRLERVAARWTDRIVVLTPRGAEEHLARRIGHPQQYVAIPSGIDLAGLRARAPGRQVARRALGLPPEAPVVIGIGRLVSVKGFDLLVQACSMIGEVRVLLVGDGPERAALDLRARACGVTGRLTIVGAQGDVAPYLAAADLLVAPSRNEGMGRVLVEAMALGVPVVGAAVGGIPSVLDGGRYGVLVPPEDPAALARAIGELLQDPGRRARLGQAGRERAEAFTVDVMTGRLAELYRSLGPSPVGVPTS
jgi:glycosyltransferase involved in cell wall biosynthesis